MNLIFDLIFSIIASFANDGENIEKLGRKNLEIQAVSMAFLNLTRPYKFENKNVKIKAPFFDWALLIKDNNLSTRIYYTGGIAMPKQSSMRYSGYFTHIKGMSKEEYKKYQIMLIKKCEEKQIKNIQIQKFKTIARSCKIRKLKNGTKIKAIEFILPNKKAFISYMPYFDGDENSKHFKRFINSIKIK